MRLYWMSTSVEGRRQWKYERKEKMTKNIYVENKERKKKKIENEEIEEQLVM